MASGSQAAVDGGDGRSGGKILKPRRTAARKTPYDRPTPPLQPESPNWLNGLVFPAKFVAGGASKLLSSFWNPKSWGSPSSSSDGDSDSEDGIEDDSEDNENLFDGAVELNQKKGRSSGKSEILYLVEQLLMLERYSREECDRLIEIINSRVVDYTMREGMDVGPSKILSRTDIETPDIRNQAITEAKRLIMDNMVGSSSKSDFDNGIHGSKSVMTQHITKGEAGSPVDVAKSYMRTRPPWVSPISHSDPPTPSPLAAELLKEGTPYSLVGGNSSSWAKRDYLSAGSWNIQDEIQRLRSKATEDMLSNHRSTKLTIEHVFPERSLPNDKAVDVMKLNEPISLDAPKPVDETVNLAPKGDMRTTQDDVPTEVLSSLPTIQEQNQMSEEQDAVSNKSYQAAHPDSEKNHRHSGGVGLEKEEETAESDERNLDQERPNNDDRVTDDVNRIEGNCDFVTESTEVPNVNEAIGIVNGSQGSSNTKKPSSKRKADSPTVRPVTRSSRYSRRGRGRGK